MKISKHVLVRENRRFSLNLLLISLEHIQIYKTLALRWQINVNRNTILEFKRMNVFLIHFIAKFSTSKFKICIYCSNINTFESVGEIISFVFCFFFEIVR